MLGIGFALIAMPALAHHSFAAEYDIKKTLTVSGTVTKVEWLNPHARLYMDVKDDAGKVANWEFELQAPNGLIRSGWTRTSIKPGDVVTVDGYRAKDGSNIGNASAITLADGRKLIGRDPDK
jgi:DNA/RNA endonuclease YhcR with UshA esterase domain